MSNPQDVANAFVAHFYPTFDQGAQNLAGLYVSPSNALVLHRCVAMGHGLRFAALLFF